MDQSFQFEISVIVLVSYFRSFEYLCHGSTTIITIQIISVRDRLYTSESDVHRRQILTYKDGPRAERLKPYKC